VKTILIVGAGQRGEGYGDAVLKRPALARVTGVAEPRLAYRDLLVARHGIAGDMAFSDWREAASRPRLADAVFICTQDRMHTEPAVAFAKRGYHILLEKPMAPTAAECRRIVSAVKEAGVLFAVCHVLRYTPYTRRLKALIAEGRIGDPVSMDHLEPVGYAHQAHSFVRGNWRREDEATFMLMAKSCHDLDWMAHVMGRPIRRVSSFGSLLHFRPEYRPPGAADRCLDCPAPVERNCPYSARKVYFDVYKRPELELVHRILSPDTTDEGILKALREGPYGRCVYACDNDVVDHQVVNLEFDGGPTASFTMTAFTRMHQHRRTRIFGTRGEIYANGEDIKVHDFLTDSSETISQLTDADAWEGHGGADQAMIDEFLQALQSGDGTRLLSGPDETLMTHLAVFAAEESRKTGQVLNVNGQRTLEAVP
jgi:predicted dehydrogenase